MIRKKLHLKGLKVGKKGLFFRDVAKRVKKLKKLGSLLREE